MSDFIYSNKQGDVESMAMLLKKIFPEPEKTEIKTFCGLWGALAVKIGPYNGFFPYENSRYICVVLGAPVLFWTGNEFLTNQNQSSIGSQAIFERWYEGKFDWTEDISGPSCVLIIDKLEKFIHCVTDLMLYVPVYHYCSKDKLVLGTHVDIVAHAAGQRTNIDHSSVVDFILNGVVTYPYTSYNEITQLAPATIHIYEKINSDLSVQRNIYWMPTESNPYRTLKDAAIELKSGICDYINRVTSNMKEIGEFISAGEDSRAIAGLLPEELIRHAYIFVDEKNREWEIAKRVANLYGCKFHYLLRSPTHYLDIIETASGLIGSGFQYTHAHPLGLMEIVGADKLLAVFGGFISDTLLKCLQRRKNLFTRGFSFFPDVELKGETRTVPLTSDAIERDMLKVIDARRRNHYQNVLDHRPSTAHEWFDLWPMSMNVHLPNITFNRRLFKSYEPFTDKTVVKISASVPTVWKLNRRLFHEAFKNSLRKSSIVPHADGRYPYFPWWANTFLQMPVWLDVTIKKIIKSKDNHGPWGNWNYITSTKEWEELMCKYEINSYGIKCFQKLSVSSKLNYMQTKYLLNDFL